MIRLQTQFDRPHARATVASPTCCCCCCCCIVTVIGASVITGRAVARETRLPPPPPGVPEPAQGARIGWIVLAVFLLPLAIALSIGAAYVTKSGWGAGVGWVGYTIALSLMSAKGKISMTATIALAALVPISMVGEFFLWASTVFKG